jgi:hypothetical protein
LGKKTDLAKIERERLLTEERRAKAKAEEAALSSHLDETAQLTAARGGELDKPKQGRGEQRKPMRRLAGLDWLRRKEKISDDHLAAGVRYGAAYRLVAMEASIRSILNREINGGEGPTLQRLKDRSASIVRAKQRLAMYRGQMMNERTLIEACDAVCGLEQTPREAAQNGRDAAAIEALVIAALGLLTLHLAPVPADAADPTQDMGQAA